MKSIEEVFMVKMRDKIELQIFEPLTIGYDVFVTLVSVGTESEALRILPAFRTYQTPVSEAVSLPNNTVLCVLDIQIGIIRIS
jgi:hypothetical protein